MSSAIHDVLHHVEDQHIHTAACLKSSTETAHLHADILACHGHCHYLTTNQFRLYHAAGRMVAPNAPLGVSHRIYSVSYTAKSATVLPFSSRAPPA